MNEYCPKGLYVLGGVRGLKRRPLTPHPSPRSAAESTKGLTDADHSRMIRLAQRRFAPTVIGITRNGDRHQIGIVIAFVGIRSQSSSYQL